MKLNSSKLYAVYLAVVSFVSIISIAITLWIVLTAVWKFYIISDDEYIQNTRSAEINECIEPKLTTWRDERIERTPEEIEECKTLAIDSAIKSRRYKFKDMFISSWARLIIFIILFIFHFPKFLKFNTKNK